MNRKARLTKKSKEKSIKTIKILSFARRRLISIGLKLVMVDGFSKPISSIKKALVYEMYKNEFGNSASHDFHLDDKSLDVFKKKKTRSQRKSENESWSQAYFKHLRSVKWKNFRLLVLATRNETCEKCNTKNSPKNLHVHHLHYKSLGDEKVEDVMLLCKPCHEEVHQKKFK